MEKRPNQSKNLSRFLRRKAYTAIAAAPIVAIAAPTMRRVIALRTSDSLENLL
jgi:hypothetical protein